MDCGEARMMNASVVTGLAIPGDGNRWRCALSWLKGIKLNVES
jgi:hypothetical protein